MEEPLKILAARLGISQEDCDAIRAGNPSALMGRFSDPLWAVIAASLLRHNGDTEKQSSDELSRAQRIIRQLKAEIATTRVIVERVAEIAGACPRCLGWNGVCPRCHGRGHPGSGELQQEEFLAWIAPAVGRVNPEGKRGFETPRQSVTRDDADAQ
jgi:hypothetical protein